MPSGQWLSLFLEPYWRDAGHPINRKSSLGSLSNRLHLLYITMEEIEESLFREYRGGQTTSDGQNSPRLCATSSAWTRSTTRPDRVNTSGTRSTWTAGSASRGSDACCVDPAIGTP